jgi:hypothetical protein
MNIYLSYIIDPTGTRMLQSLFDKLCMLCKYDNQAIRIRLTKYGWRLDTGFGIDMEEAINMSQLRANYNQPCEGRR